MTPTASSPAQERLWLLEQARPGEVRQRTQLVVELAGQLEVASLRRALDAVATANAAELAFDDRPNAPTSSDPESVARWVREVIRQPLPMTPVLRAVLLPLGAREHVLVLVAHRAAVDERSMRVLFHDLVAAYRSPAEGEDRPAPTRRGQQAPIRDADLGFWLTQLADADYGVVPPPDLPPAAEPAAETGRSSVSLDRQVLTSLAGRLTGEAPLSAILLTAYVQLLARYTGEYDLTVALPGMVLRVDLTDNPAFRQAARRVNSVVTAAGEHDSVPVEILLAELTPEHYLAHGPLAQAGFEFAAPLPESAESAGLRMTVLDIAHPNPEYPFTLRVKALAGEPIVELLYRADRYSEGFATTFLRAYRTLLQRVAANPGLAVQDVRLAAVEPRGPQRTVRRYPRVTELVERAMANDPGAPAIVSGDRSWSYRELHERAGEFAEGLRSAGHRTGETVALCTATRSFDLYASLLGVWRAGGVLVLVDPALSGQAREQRLNQARARTVVVFDDEQGFSTVRRDGSAGTRFSGDDPAYIFFTSGTTGTPKALLGEHNSLSHFILWQQEEFEFRPSDRCAQLTSLFTDGMLRDIFTPLASGSSVHIPADGAVHPSDPAILGWLKKSAVTRAHTMPALSSRWLGETAAVGPLEDLRLLFFSGEPLTGALATRWHAVAPGAGLVNLYGTSECTMIQAFHRVGRSQDTLVHPAGQAMAGAELLVRTPSGTSCGPGEIGEVHIHTPYASAGYIGRTDSAFVRSGDDPAARVFRAGDRARLRANGTLEVFGRSSDGERGRAGKVDPEQVNALLARQRGVRASAVVRLDRAEPLPRFAAFVVLDRPRATTPAEIRRALRAHLPPAALPDHIRLLPDLPVNDVGKLDRRALRTLFAEQQATEGDAFSRSPVARKVADVWCEVLRLAGIAPDDHFFELGGDPREAVDVVRRLRSELATPLDIDAVFTAPVLSEFVLTVEHA
ncbi:AMP-binding protein [Amycolatopsis rhizosphaerae]|uniref:AMP-binding protein n=1 Tax=Amycolatopsis rhizosphaerae TaxID=2053003 RepID=A0A558DNP6_9PSEU|nr:AMP-binding protein [Amycolatopsis rhizosphaerae]TVT62636.1 AMP-binding protein [Amycolatopsis rhizosphaerae]